MLVLSSCGIAWNTSWSMKNLTTLTSSIEGKSLCMGDAIILGLKCSKLLEIEKASYIKGTWVTQTIWGFIAMFLNYRLQASVEFNDPW